MELRESQGVKPVVSLPVAKVEQEIWTVCIVSGTACSFFMDSI